MYQSDRFKLIINEDEQKLLFNNEPVLRGCENLIKLMAELGVVNKTPSILSEFDLSQEELTDLEITLAKAILDDDKCMPNITEDEFD